MAVPGFFVLQRGFVLAHNYADHFSNLQIRSVLIFLGRRLVRIYPVHLMTLLSVLVMVLVAGHLDYQLAANGYTLQTFVENLFLVHYWLPSFTLSWNFPSWSISAEWFAYLLFPLIACGLASQRS